MFHALDISTKRLELTDVILVTSIDVIDLVNLRLTFGHNAGMESLRAVIKACVSFGVKYLTVYAFSTENWGRPQDEVAGLEKPISDSVRASRKTC